MVIHTHNMVSFNCRASDTRTSRLRRKGTGVLQYTHNQTKLDRLQDDRYLTHGVPQLLDWCHGTALPKEVSCGVYMTRLATSGSVFKS